MALECDIVLEAELIVTQDAQRSVIHSGAVAVQGSSIVAVGEVADIRAAYAPKQCYSLGRALLMPGLINAHTHLGMTFMRGLADDLPLMQWLTEHIFPLEKQLSPHIVTTSSLFGCAEMLRTGTTACQDMYLLEDAALEAVATFGLRAVMGEVIFSFPSPAYSNVEAAFALIKEQVARYAGHERIKVGVMPHAVYTTHPELLQRCKALAQEHGLPFHMHLAESATETAMCLAQHGLRPIAYCHKLGLLDAGTSLAHVVDITDAEQDLLAETEVVLVHNPRSNMKLASGISPVSRLQEKGLRVALGTDGAASNNALNMFIEMQTCALLHKVQAMDATSLPAQTVLDMGTRNGAAALGATGSWLGLGMLAPGSPADMIALDLDAPNLVPLYHPVSHLAYAATGHEVCLSMVHGKVLYEQGVFTGFDYPSLLQEMRDIQAWVRQHVM